jgi:hypothetical protein
MRDRDQFVRRESHDIRAEALQKNVNQLQSDMRSAHTSQRTWLAAITMFLIILNIILRYIR